MEACYIRLDVKIVFTWLKNESFRGFETAARLLYDSIGEICSPLHRQLGWILDELGKLKLYRTCILYRHPNNTLGDGASTFRL